MLEFYDCRTEIYHNGTFIHSSYSGRMLAESTNVPEKKVTLLTWENLEEKQGEIYDLPFGVFHFKKGRQVSFFNGSWIKKDFRDIKEWKSPLNIEVHEVYRKITPNLQDVFNWYNAEKAAQYLKEHNISL